MKQKISSIFLCHSSLDKYFVGKLTQDLEEAGVDVWTYEVKIKAGDSVIEEISRAIEKVDYVGVVLSSNSLSSRWVKHEIDVAMYNQIEEGSVIVIPLLLEQVKRPTILKPYLI